MHLPITKLALVLASVLVVLAYAGHYPTDPYTPQALTTRNGFVKQLFFDFDGTVTTSESFLQVPMLAYTCHPNSNATTPSTADSTSTILSWSHFAKHYIQALAELREKYGPLEILEDELTMLNSPDNLRMTSYGFYGMQDAGVFTATDNDCLTQKLTDVARYVQLREGWCELLEKAQAEGVKVNILTLNWSGKFVRTILRQASGCPELSEFVNIYSPEILPEGALPDAKTNLVTGEENNEVIPMFIGLGKTVLIKKLIKDEPEQEVVFVSDSLNDLSALWKDPTTLGILVPNPNQTAIPDLTQRYGKELWTMGEHEGHWKEMNVSGEAGDGKGLYYLEKWSQLWEFLGWGRDEAHVQEEKADLQSEDALKVMMMKQGIEERITRKQAANREVEMVEAEYDGLTEDFLSKSWGPEQLAPIFPTRRSAPDAHHYPADDYEYLFLRKAGSQLDALEKRDLEQEEPKQRGEEVEKQNEVPKEDASLIVNANEMKRVWSNIHHPKTTIMPQVSDPQDYDRANRLSRVWVDELQKGDVEEEKANEGKPKETKKTGVHMEDPRFYDMEQVFPVHHSRTRSDALNYPISDYENLFRSSPESPSGELEKGNLGEHNNE